MTFDERFEKVKAQYYNLSSLDKPQHELHFHVDFVELITLFSNGEEVSKGDIQDRYFGTNDNTEIFDDIYDNSSEEEKKDNQEKFISQIFSMIQERSGLFDSSYPFEFDLSKGILRLKLNISERQKVYLSLLCSSVLNIFKSFQNILTKDFESISYYSLKGYLPERAVVKNFGIDSDYSGTAISKIKDLAKDIGLFTDSYELEGINPRNTKERGLDLVAWLPFNDKCQNVIVYLAQCACGKEYESKQHDTRRFESYFKFYKSSPQHVLFTSYSLINTHENKFYHSDLIEKNFLIFERKRIIDFSSELQFQKTESYTLVQKCINYRESLV